MPVDLYQNKTIALAHFLQSNGNEEKSVNLPP